MSRCFSDFAGYFCRYWGNEKVQGKTDISEEIYMLCVRPSDSKTTTTTQGSILGDICTDASLRCILIKILVQFIFIIPLRSY